MKHALLALLLLSCSTTKNLDNWLGHTKQELVLNWGPPSQTDSDGNGGEILTYSNVYKSPFTGDYFDKIRLMYVDASAKVYAWRQYQRKVNPTQIIVK